MGKNVMYVMHHLPLATLSEWCKLPLIMHVYNLPKNVRYLELCLQTYTCVSQVTIIFPVIIPYLTGEITFTTPLYCCTAVMEE